jgi:hypothetical protein
MEQKSNISKKIKKHKEAVFEISNNKTTFQKEWQNSILADKAFDALLNHVRHLWKE